MQETIINQVLPPVFTALAVGVTGVFVAVIKSVGTAIIDYLGKKKKVVEKDLQLSKHQEQINTAKTIWNIVEEKYRITDNIKESLSSKADEFDRLLLEKIPYLNKEQVAELRQALAGEINKGKEALFKDSFKEEIKKISEENNKLIQENIDLKSKLTRISEVVPKEQE